MILLVLALTYLVGIAVGRWFWQMDWIGCAFPAWLWIAPVLSLPIWLWLDHAARPLANIELRWPASAGFVPPRPGIRPWLLLAAVTAMGAGVLRYASHPLEPCWQATDLAYYNNPADVEDGDSVTLIGSIANYPTVSDGRQRLQVDVSHLVDGGKMLPVRGLVQLGTRPLPRYEYGQRVQISGILVEPPVFDSFDYRAYLARKGVHSLLQRPRIEVLPGDGGSSLLRSIYVLRGRGEALLNRLLPEPYAALANGMLLGIESGIPDDLYEQFNLTGTSHTIVISGSNVAIVAGVLVAVMARLVGKRRALWPTLIGIAVYAFLVGGDAAVIRAALMGSLVVIASAINRQSTALVSLAFACWVMTLINPLTLWDVGFQLSASATAGLMIFSPGLTAFFDRLWPGFGQGGHLTGEGGIKEAGGSLMRGLLQDGLLVTLAANFTTLPLVVYYFQRLSLVSPLTNLLVSPAQPFIMLWGGAGVIVGLSGIELLAQAFLWIPYVSLLWTVTMVQWTAALPGASVEISEYSGAALVTTYLLLGMVRWREWLQERFSHLRSINWTGAWIPRVVGGGAFAGLSVAAFLVWRIVLTQPDGYLHVHFLDVGQGDSIFIQTPSGRQVLIDGGSDPQRLFAELGEVMPFWDRNIDLLVLTHPDLDHMGAQLTLPERFKISQAVVSNVTLDDEDGDPWRAGTAYAGIPIAVQGAGGWIDLGDGVALWSLWPPDENAVRLVGIDGDNKNERSLVQKLVYGEFSVLLTGDAGTPSEDAMMRRGNELWAQVLKVGHHGSNSSTGPEWVRIVNPSVAVIQVGENRYGHPHQEVLDALAGRLVLRNDEHGRVHIWSDGVQMWIGVEQGSAALPNWLETAAGSLSP